MQTLKPGKHTVDKFIDEKIRHACTLVHVHMYVRMRVCVHESVYLNGLKIDYKLKTYL